MLAISRFEVFCEPYISLDILSPIRGHSGLIDDPLLVTCPWEGAVPLFGLLAIAFWRGGRLLFTSLSQDFLIMSGHVVSHIGQSSVTYLNIVSVHY